MWPSFQWQKLPPSGFKQKCIQLSFSVALVPCEPKLLCEVLSLSSPKHKSHTDIILVLPNCRRKLTIHYCKLEIIEVAIRRTITSPPAEFILLIYILTIFPQRISLNIKNIPKHLSMQQFFHTSLLAFFCLCFLHLFLLLVWLLWFVCFNKKNVEFWGIYSIGKEINPKTKKGHMKVPGLPLVVTGWEILHPYIVSCSLWPVF